MQGVFYRSGRYPRHQCLTKVLVKVESERYSHTYDQTLDSTTLGAPEEPAIKLDGSLVRMRFWIERLDDFYDGSSRLENGESNAAWSLLFCPFEAGVSKWFGENWSLEQTILRRTYVKIPGSPLFSHEGYTSQEGRLQWYAIPRWFIGGLLKVPAKIGDYFSTGWGSGVDLDIELAMYSHVLHPDGAGIVPMTQKSIALRFIAPSRNRTLAETD